MGAGSSTKSTVVQGQIFAWSRAHEAVIDSDLAVAALFVSTSVILAYVGFSWLVCPPIVTPATDPPLRHSRSVYPGWISTFVKD